MIARRLAVHGTLALITTAAAYVAFFHPREQRNQAAITLLAGRPQALTSIAWSDADKDVTVQRQNGSVVVELKRHGLDDTVKSYPSSTAATALFDKLAPFLAVRDLGMLDEEHLSNFGLKPETANLTLHYGEHSTVFHIGTSAFGIPQTYVMGQNGHVFLVLSSVLADLKNGSHALPERNLVTIPRDRVERMILTVEDREHELIQHQREDRANAYWTEVGAPDTKLPQFATWLDRLFQARMHDFAPESPIGNPVLIVQFWGEGRELYRCAFWPVEKGAIVMAASFSLPVLIPQTVANNLLRNLDQVFSGSETN